ncbi:response regulator transcription factor RpaB [Acaryochloris sp. CCMEE 5410]|uniref:response regulator transcription factor RpaB n=1 Tax=Acaryochloris sp. CCMEE 5410 TaxID=310037 RepID=UPI0002484FF4|nr:response regulator transcription factor [Acaryochloris sp. CCMEE 5410]KAI9134952.1 response regulator transcription factor [Acaryochloris sp. CCMEE 5410]
MKDQQQKILVADDEASIRRILETRLSMMGFVVITAADGEEALQVFQHQEPDLIILDVMMPKLNGYQVCQSLRQESDVPIIMLTALSDVADRITGLEMGADDYMVKPFSPKELESRIRCILRRITKSHSAHHKSAGVIQVGHLEIDTNKRQVYKDKERIQLTHLEFNLLELLVSRPGEPISRVEFLQKVWGYSPDGKIDTRVVDVHMSRLRNKLKEDTEEPDLILSVRGVGYAIQRGD